MRERALSESGSVLRLQVDRRRCPVHHQLLYIISIVHVQITFHSVGNRCVTTIVLSRSVARPNSTAYGTLKVMAAKTIVDFWQWDSREKMFRLKGKRLHHIKLHRRALPRLSVFQGLSSLFVSSSFVWFCLLGCAGELLRSSDRASWRLIINILSSTGANDNYLTLS
nr:hypothetical protein CFP56_37039 [Quercus suber]